MDKMESIFKVMRYERKCCSKRKLRYPTFKVSGSDEIYFRTLDDVEQYVQKHPAKDDYIDHAPTICVFEPTKQVSARRRQTLLKLYEEYKNKSANVII